MIIRQMPGEAWRFQTFVAQLHISRAILGSVHFGISREEVHLAMLQPAGCA